MRFRYLAALVAVALLVALPVVAQEQRGSIDGVVKDAQGGAIVGATVVAKSMAGATVEAVTDATGTAAVEAWIASAASPGDLCGDRGAAHPQAHCPICHKLGETPRIRLAPRVLRLALVPVWSAMPADLHLEPQRGNPNRAARAPPTLV